jgi:hypothetical protein
VSALSAAGFNVEVQTGVGSQTFQSTTVAGRVDNVIATLPGYDSTGSVVVAAHYDSTFGTPGAADDKASVAAMLETARALASAERLRNDVVMIFTDGEEAVLLGASSFVAEHPLADPGGVVLNWEATGNAGLSVMFETSLRNAELIKELAASAPYPVGDSALAALYQAGTQNSDFTVFREAGFVGLNFALIDGVSAYHHVRDTAANFDPAGLQHMGANMLGARGLAERDLAAARARPTDGAPEQSPRATWRHGRDAAADRHRARGRSFRRRSSAARQSAVCDGCRHADCHLGQPDPYAGPVDSEVRAHLERRG